MHVYLVGYGMLLLRREKEKEDIIFLLLPFPSPKPNPRSKIQNLLIPKCNSNGNWKLEIQNGNKNGRKERTIPSQVT